MLLPSSQHSLNVIFVVLCVIAGANSQPLLNSSGTATNMLNHRYRYAFTDLILDASLINPSHVSRKVESNGTSESSIKLQQSHLMDISLSNSNNLSQAHNVCTLLSNVFHGNKMKFCIKHQELIEKVLPQIIKLTKTECMRITQDLPWNCTSLGPFLDRSSYLAFTREAALIKSMLNASTMYLIVKLCTDHSYHSCGCSSYRELVDHPIPSIKAPQFKGQARSEMSSSLIDQVSFNLNEIDKLEAGSSLRLSRSMVKRQSCQVNTAFAAALTAMLFDADESRSMAKAARILNENLVHTQGRRRRLHDQDVKDLAFIKWTKSAVNLHNNHVGRQLVRKTIRKQCRCHGLSGACQFQTCWDQVGEFSDVASSIRSMYLDNAHLVSFKNLGSLDQPDIFLSKSSHFIEPSHLEKSHSSNNTSDRIRPNELAFLYNSPNYCEVQLIVEHRGTKGRQCSIEMETNNTSTTTTTTNRVNFLSKESINSTWTQQSSLSSCTFLCCGRGYTSEIILHVVKCECRFRFCCKVECADCVRQQLHHRCL